MRLYCTGPLGLAPTAPLFLTLGAISGVRVRSSSHALRSTDAFAFVLHCGIAS